MGEIQAKRNKNQAYFGDGSGITYTCKSGYSFTENRVSDTERTVHCQANGTLSQLRPSRCTGKHLICLPFYIVLLCQDFCFDTISRTRWRMILPYSSVHRYCSSNDV